MESLLGHNTRRPDITFYRSGRIDITARIANIIGLRDGDVIDIGREDGEYYLYRLHKAGQTIGRHEAQCMSTHKGRLHPSRNLRAFSKRLTDCILSMTTKGDTARVWCGGTTKFDNGETAVIIIIPSFNLIKQ
ncbi:MAG: hypothetical protein MJY49_03030 [Bacteroidales bacterium]|nr:hypothetical protein [Bacteroidales bacterium]